MAQYPEEEEEEETLIKPVQKKRKFGRLVSNIDNKMVTRALRKKIVQIEEELSVEMMSERSGKEEILDEKQKKIQELKDEIEINAWKQIQL